MPFAADPNTRSNDSRAFAATTEAQFEPGISVVIITRDRFARLVRTLDAVRALVPAPKQIIVVDNASSDDTAQKLAGETDVHVIRLNDNTGVEAFNIGAAGATRKWLLILDDDAAPEPESWSRAIKLLDDQPEIDAIAFNPVHPATGALEWPDASRSCTRFNRMGCANLIRASTWKKYGGYLAAYFLYRNDTDLALTILSRGGTIHFDPSLRAVHDSPFAAAKSERWLELATRNWIWMGRRHGRGLWKMLGILFGVCRAIMFAGLNARRISCVLRGALQGLRDAPPTLDVTTDGLAWKSLITARLGM